MSKLILDKKLSISEEVKANIWATILVLIWLNEKCSHKKMIWNLLQKKSKKWLLEFKVNYEDYMGI